MSKRTIARRLAEAYVADGPSLNIDEFDGDHVQILARVIDQLSASDAMLVRTAIELPSASLIDSAVVVLELRLKQAGVPGDS